MFVSFQIKFNQNIQIYPVPFPVHIRNKRNFDRIAKEKFIEQHNNNNEDKNKNNEEDENNQSIKKRKLFKASRDPLTGKWIPRHNSKISKNDDGRPWPEKLKLWNQSYENARKFIPESLDDSDEEKLETLNLKCEKILQDFEEQASETRKLRQIHVPVAIKCPSCDMLFPTLKKHVYHHVKKDHPEYFPTFTKDFMKINSCRSDEMKQYNEYYELTENGDIRCIFDHQCGKEFKNRGHFIRHLRGVHFNIKDFACDFPGCDYKTGDSSNLYHHKLSHSDNPLERLPIQCERCPKRFARRYNYTAHLKTTHYDLFVIDKKRRQDEIEAQKAETKRRKAEQKLERKMKRSEARQKALEKFL